MQVTVETLEKGFLINVISAKSCPGLLVPILEAFEEMGLSVMEARASCTDTFRFQAVGGEVRYLYNKPSKDASFLTAKCLHNLDGIIYSLQQQANTYIARRFQNL